MDTKVTQIAVGVAGALIALGTLLPWISVGGMFSVSRNGFDMSQFDAVIILLAGLGIGFMGLMGLNTNKLRLVFWASVLAAVMTGYVHQKLLGRIESLNENDLLVASIGAGIWVVYAGAVVGAVASVLRLKETSTPLVGRAMYDTKTSRTSEHQGGADP